MRLCGQNDNCNFSGNSGWRSVYAEIAAVDDGAGIAPLDLFLQIHFTARPEIELVIEDEQFRLCLRSQFRELPGGRVERGVVLAPALAEDNVEAVGRVDLVQQNVASFARLLDLFAGRRIP